MKLERLSENQIRCTLNKADLADRDLLLNELAYGTDKAKALFHDMMQQASYELGFDAEDIPLTIEAIPVSPECLILVITKVDDPDELDTRFSKFTSPSEFNMEDSDLVEDGEDSEIDEQLLTSFDDANADIYSLLNDASAEHNQVDNDSEPTDKNTSANIYKIFKFKSLEDVTQASKMIFNSFEGRNILFKDSKKGGYYLVVYKSFYSHNEFLTATQLFSEYGQSYPVNYATVAHMREHFDLILGEHAIEILAQI